MSAAPAVGELRCALTVATLTARRAARSGAAWGLLFGVLIFNEAVTYHTSSPTPQARADIVRTFGDNAAFAAILGPARRLDTAAGFVSWRLLALLVWVGAIWGLLTATRLLRRGVSFHAAPTARTPTATAAPHPDSPPKPDASPARRE
jgi:putative exporter of polyketide antibiotics